VQVPFVVAGIVIGVIVIVSIGIVGIVTNARGCWDERVQQLCESS
jgi:hypothetical protein